MGRIGRAGLSVLGLVLMSGGAQAGLEICNKTELLQSLSIGYKGDTDWTSEGWWNIEPGECAIVVAGDLTKRYYYYYAESKGVTFESQNFEFCTADEVFTIVGDTDCESRGYDTERFREIDTGETAKEFTLSLVDKGLPEAPSSAPVVGSASGPGGGASSTQSTDVAPEVTTIEVETADLTSGMPPGQHGTPFSVSALFQGCELEQGKSFCSFHADGIKLRAFYSGPTPEGLMYALEEMAVNTPVRLEGDRAERESLQTAVVLREVVADPTGDRDATLRRDLQGDWVSEQDRRIGFTIRGSELYTRYDGEFRGARFLRIAPSCDASRGKGPVLLQVKTSDRSEACFVINSVRSGVLELIDPNRNALLRYVKDS